MSNSLLPLCAFIAGALVALPAQASPQRLCPADRPCILAVFNERANLVVEWNDSEERDHYNLRWSRPDKAAKQVEVSGGRGGRFTLKNFKPDTLYTFAVQGCRKPLIGRSTCTPWYEETVTSCGARATPCR
ncbi:MAG TPA: fibronectin type III domain-containing protein [Anaeromyxobacter sp.]